MPAEDDLVLVLSTTETLNDADTLAKELVERNLAACVQIDGPVRSHYRWAGETRLSEEYRLQIKTRSGLWQQLHNKLTSLHPYEEPEIVMMPIHESSKGYRDWVIDQTS